MKGGIFISRRKTHEEFIEELRKINPNVEVLTKYEGAHIKVHCRCLVDGYEWWTKPCQLLQGRGCRVCGYKTVSEKLQKSFEENVRLITEKNPNIEVLERFFSGKCWKVKCRCKIDGYEWAAAPHRIVSGDGCSRCAGMEKKTLEQFQAELKEVNPHIEVIGEYKGTHTKIKCRCLRDGHEWSATPRNLLAGWGCPHCRMSRGERKISNYLKSHEIEYKSQHSFENCKDEHALLFDFYVPSYNLAIEFDGEQHFRPVKFGGKEDDKAEARFKKLKKHDEIKTQYCIDNNIGLLRIDYTQFEMVETILDKQFS